ncbi:MAG: YkgJ family cysteine cluster protein [Myxococcales bacterium]|nr:YkgJ family cysteine cluster protein [Myxococcales bacterium]
MPGRAELAALHAKVAAFEAVVEAGQGRFLECRRGCDGCCRTARSAWAVELDHLRTFLHTLPAADLAALRARRDAPAVLAGERCVFLDDDGGCAVYAARPVICRTHGPAVRTPDDALTWCALNFAEMSADAVAAAVPTTAIINLALLDSMLALINVRYVAHTGADARGPLTDALQG